MKAKRFLRDNGLSIVLFALTLSCLAGHLIAGHRTYLQQSEPHAPLSLASYALSSHFLGSLFENWESEFLQMGAYVLLTVSLFQRGSGDSKDPDGGDDPVDEDPRLHAKDAHAPWPVRRGGIALRFYSWSLTLALCVLFLVSMWCHLAATNARLRAEAPAGSIPPSLADTAGSAEFWFESFQNWQSEFLSITALVLLSIFLRQRGSPESKPVHFAHSRTGKG